VWLPSFSFYAKKKYSSKGRIARACTHKTYVRKGPRLTVQKCMHDKYTLLLYVPFEIVSPCIDTPLPAFPKVVEAASEGTFLNAVLWLS
jgi:hypothetical protein